MPVILLYSPKDRITNLDGLLAELSRRTLSSQSIAGAETAAKPCILHGHSLTNASSVVHVQAIQGYEHLDFLWGDRAAEEVIDPILKHLIN